MKALIKTFAVVAILMTTAATIFVSCKKDNDETLTPNRQTEMKSDAQVVYEKVKKFESLRKSYHSNSRSDNGSVTVSEARLILDASINYEYSDVNRCLDDRDLDTLYYTAPVVNSQGEVALNDIIEIYDRFSSDIEEMGNTVNMFMVTFHDANTRSNRNVEIVYTRGTPSPTPTPTQTPGILPNYPFGPDEDYIWYEAAQKLTEKIAQLTNNRSGSNKVVYDTAQIKPMIWDMEYKYRYAEELPNIESCSEYWLFMERNVTPEEASSWYIDNVDLNCFFRNILHYVINDTGCFHYSPILNSPYREVMIGWNNSNPNNGNLIDIFHYAYITYYKVGAVQ